MTDSREDKKQKIGPMFDKIAFRYDFLNHFLSFGTDRIWRRKAIRLISESAAANPEILDVATGTADLAIESLRIDPKHVTGIDISKGMLELGKIKIAEGSFREKITLMEGNSEMIPFADDYFDVAMVAFGVRNFSDPLKGLSEMRRVIRPGGQVLVLEFSKPQRFPLKQLYYLYFRYILPVIGRIFSGDREAYRYLYDSVMQFPDNEKFTEMMNRAGLIMVKQMKLTGGIASIYTGLKNRVQ